MRVQAQPAGAGGRTRTGTVSLPVDFESTTSANSITPAGIWKSRYYYTVSSPKLQPLFQKNFIFSLPISTFHKLASKAPTHYNCWPRDLLILRSTTESNHPWERSCFPNAIRKRPPGKYPESPFSKHKEHTTYFIQIGSVALFASVTKVSNHPGLP